LGVDAKGVRAESQIQRECDGGLRPTDITAGELEKHIRLHNQTKRERDAVFAKARKFIATDQRFCDLR